MSFPSYFTEKPYRLRVLVKQHHLQVKRTRRWGRTSLVCIEDIYIRIFPCIATDSVFLQYLTAFWFLLFISIFARYADFITDYLVSFLTASNAAFYPHQVSPSEAGIWSRLSQCAYLYTGWVLWSTGQVGNVTRGRCKVRTNFAHLFIYSFLCLFIYSFAYLILFVCLPSTENILKLLNDIQNDIQM